MADKWPPQDTVPPADTDVSKSPAELIAAIVHQAETIAPIEVAMYGKKEKDAVPEAELKEGVDLERDQAPVGGVGFEWERDPVARKEELEGFGYASGEAPDHVHKAMDARDKMLAMMQAGKPLGPHIEIVDGVPTFEGVPLDIQITGEIRSQSLSPGELLVTMAATVTAGRAMYDMLKGFVAINQGKLVIKSDLLGNHTVEELMAGWSDFSLKFKSEEGAKEWRTEKQTTLRALVGRKAAALKRANMPQEGANSIDEFVTEKILKSRLRPSYFESSAEIAPFVNELPISDSAKGRLTGQLVAAFEEKTLGDDEKDIREAASQLGTQSFDVPEAI